MARQQFNLENTEFVILKDKFTTRELPFVDRLKFMHDAVIFGVANAQFLLQFALNSSGKGVTVAFLVVYLTTHQVEHAPVAVPLQQIFAIFPTANGNGGEGTALTQITEHFGEVRRPFPTLNCLLTRNQRAAQCQALGPRRIIQPLKLEGRHAVEKDRHREMILKALWTIRLSNLPQRKEKVEQIFRIHREMRIQVIVPFRLKITQVREKIFKGEFGRLQQHIFYQQSKLRRRVLIPQSLIHHLFIQAVQNVGAELHFQLG